MSDDEYATFLRQELARLEAADEPLRRAAEEAADPSSWGLFAWPAPTHRQPNRVHFGNRS